MASKPPSSSRSSRSAAAGSSKKAGKGRAAPRLDLQHALNPLKTVLRRSALRTPEVPDLPQEPEPKKPARSPLAPEGEVRLPAIEGVQIATARTGIKYKGRPDLLVARFQPGTRVAGIFTQSGTAAAPVDWCREALDRNTGGEGRLLIVNAGNANAFTGKAGRDTVKAVTQAGAKAAKCRRSGVFMCSTGVIGEPLDAQPIVERLPQLCEDRRSSGAKAWADAADAIMTTDTFPKLATAQAQIDGETVTINGIAKGSGMVAPDMATMLAFLFTDANLPGDVLQTLLMLGARDTFNTVTVDGDTSTNDSLMAFATGCVEHGEVARAGDRRLADFRTQWHAVMHDLALQIVRDGEGATKLIKVHVTGADTAKSANRIARSIADSPLVKTAVAGEDANWGRIVMAVGKAGTALDQTALAISIGGLPVASKGARDPAYDEDALSRHMKEQTIEIAVDVGLGSGTATVWTCDLTHGYIAINADYRS